MSENNCAVYVHVNLINGKKYFGITIQEPEKRWQNGHGYYNNAHFKNAILKYSWGNFGHFVLYKNIPINIAKNIEEMLIDEHMSYDPRFGYNRTYGGELEKHTKETRRKMSKSLKGHEVTEETKKKIGDAMRGDKNPMKRPEIVTKRSKPVEAIDPKTGERVHCFKSTADAGRAGFSHSHVCECCNGKQKTHAGLIWRYIEGGENDDTDSGQ